MRRLIYSILIVIMASTYWCCSDQSRKQTKPLVQLIKEDDSLQADIKRLNEKMDSLGENAHTICYSDMAKWKGMYDTVMLVTSKTEEVRRKLNSVKMGMFMSVEGDNKSSLPRSMAVKEMKKPKEFKQASMFMLRSNGDSSGGLIRSILNQYCNDMMKIGDKHNAKFRIAIKNLCPDSTVMTGSYPPWEAVNFKDATAAEDLVFMNKIESGILQVQIESVRRPIDSLMRVYKSGEPRLP